MWDKYTNVWFLSRGNLRQNVLFDWQKDIWCTPASIRPRADLLNAPVHRVWYNMVHRYTRTQVHRYTSKSSIRSATGWSPKCTCALSTQYATVCSTVYDMICTTWYRSTSSISPAVSGADLLMHLYTEYDTTWYTGTQVHRYTSTSSITITNTMFQKLSCPALQRGIAYSCTAGLSFLSPKLKRNTSQMENMHFSTQCTSTHVWTVDLTIYPHIYFPFESFYIRFQHNVYFPLRR